MYTVYLVYVSGCLRASDNYRFVQCSFRFNRMRTINTRILHKYTCTVEECAEGGTFTEYDNGFSVNTETYSYS